MSVVSATAPLGDSTSGVSSSSTALAGNVFCGLGAFPLTPLTASGELDEAAFTRQLDRLASSAVDSITVLGSTGSYMYLSTEQRARVVELAVATVAGRVPVIAGVGAISLRDVLAYARHAESAGARGLLLAPCSYQTLTEEECYGLYAAVADSGVALPLCVYDAPSTTKFTFSDELHGRIAQLPNVRAIKIPGVPSNAAEARARVAKLRALIPARVAIGVSNDPYASTGLNAGCDAWFSVLGGTYPARAVELTRAALAGDAAGATKVSDELEPLWAFFRRHGSVRVIAAAAEMGGIACKEGCLPLPLKSIQGEERTKLAAALKDLKLE